QLERARLRRLELQGDFLRRRRRELERNLGNQAERAERARDQPRHVVAGDVLHHLAAEAERLAAAVDQLYAQHEVAQRAGTRTPRPGEPGGDAAAERRARAEMRRFERQALPVLLEKTLQF